MRVEGRVVKRRYDKRKVAQNRMKLVTGGEGQNSAKFYNRGCAPQEPRSRRKAREHKKAQLCTSRSALSGATKGQKCVEAQLEGGKKKNQPFLLGPKQLAL